MAWETSIGERIAELREERAMTQVELAKKAGISPSTLSLIESGRVERPHRVTVRRISEALGVEPQELRKKPPADAIRPVYGVSTGRAWAPELVEHSLTDEEWVRLLREVEALVREVRHLQQDVANGELSERVALKRIARDIEPLERALAAR